MCENISTSIILGTLALVPGTTSRYVCLAFATASFIFLAARHQGPAQKFTKLEDAIEDLEDILERTKAASSYARNHMDLIDAGCRLLQVKLSASKIQSHLLDMRSATWKNYFRSVPAIIQTSTNAQRKSGESRPRCCSSSRRNVARTVVPNPTPTFFRNPTSRSGLATVPKS
ncbi:hypothetical protein B0H13DRAFT_1936590 [Mycena leptocephala]|nr:hypothetical protein B0H13DRAFT_1936590 [Mycena leptocephala]